MWCHLKSSGKCGKPTYAETGRVASATPAVYEFPDQTGESDPCTSAGMAIFYYTRYYTSIILALNIGTPNVAQGS